MKHMRMLTAMALMVAASTVGAQNLLTNGTFDSDLSGWETYDDRASWRGDMGNTLTGGSGPGAVEIRGDGADCNGATTMIGQTVAVVPGKTMKVRVAAFLPGGDNEALAVSAKVYWKDASNNIIATTELTPQSVERDQWFWIEAVTRVPEGAAYGEFLFGTKLPTGNACTAGAWAIFDDAWLGTIPPELFVPAAASAPGANGTYWSTTLWAINPNDVEVRLDGAFLPAGQDNSGALASLRAITTIPAHGATEVTDVVAALGGSGAGGLFLRVVDAATGDSPPEGIDVVTYTFTPSSSGGGNYGQGIPAVTPGEKESVRCPGVRHDGSFRTNVGVLNTSGEQISVEVEIRGTDGTVLGSESWTLPPYGQRQESVASLGVTGLVAGYAVVTRTAGSGGFRAYLSRVDNATGDAVYVLGR